MHRWFNKILFRRLVYLATVGFIALNIIVFMHAYKFTHFVESNIPKTKSPKDLSWQDKLKPLFLGINNPRPYNKTTPHQPYQTIHLQSNKKIECWLIEKQQSKGIVVLFHGYTGKKSAILDKSNEFLAMGYDTFLVDFMGSGGSEGNQTTIGFEEAEQVKTSLEYLQKQGKKNIILFGNSMGSVAIMKAISDFNLSVQGLILECPFGSMYQTTCARFKQMGVPYFPFAGFLVFWGGVQNGFWAFDHRPIDYASSIHVPVLLLYGEKDKEVSKTEIESIFSNLKGKKILKTYPAAGHENYLLKYAKNWRNDVYSFLHDL